MISCFKGLIKHKCILNNTVLHAVTCRYHCLRFLLSEDLAMCSKASLRIQQCACLPVDGHQKNGQRYAQ